jgi:hypothetical protein
MKKLLIAVMLVLCTAFSFAGNYIVHDFNDLNTCLVMQYQQNLDDWDLGNMNDNDLHCTSGARNTTMCGYVSGTGISSVNVQGTSTDKQLILNAWNFVTPKTSSPYVDVQWIIPEEDRFNLTSVNVLADLIIAFDINVLYDYRSFGTSAYGQFGMRLNPKVQLMYELHPDYPSWTEDYYVSFTRYLDNAVLTPNLVTYMGSAQNQYWPGDADIRGLHETTNNINLSPRDILWYESGWKHIVVKYTHEKVNDQYRKIKNYTIYEDGIMVFNYTNSAPTFPSYLRYVKNFDATLDITGIRFYAKNMIIGLDNVGIFTSDEDYETWYNLTYGEEEGSGWSPTLPSSSDLCPIANCMFYEDFDTYPWREVAGTNMTIWIPYNTLTYNFTDEIDDKLYFESNLIATGQTDLTSITWIPKPTYENVVVSYIDLYLNETQPYYYGTGGDYLDTTLFYYLGFMYTSGSSNLPANDYVLEVKPYDATTYTLIVNDYSSFVLEPVYTANIKKSLGQPSLRFVFDYKADKGAITMFQNGKQVSEHYFFSLTSTESQTEPEKIMITRLDYTNMSWGHFGIDEIRAYYTTYTDFGWYAVPGGDSYVPDGDESGFDNPDINATTIDQAIQAFASTFGFNSMGGRMLFWILFSIAVCVFAMVLLPMEGAIGKFVVGTVFALMFITGWFMSFIPTIVFIFVLILALIVIGFYIKSVFGVGG